MISIPYSNSSVSKQHTPTRNLRILTPIQNVNATLVFGDVHFSLSILLYKRFKVSPMIPWLNLQSKSSQIHHHPMLDR